MRAFLTVCAVAILATVFIGCAQHTEPVAPVEPHTRGQENFTAAWDATLEVLRRYYFVVDRHDRRAGVINTKPMVSRLWFEFWRGDSFTVESAMESSLQTVLRTAEITIRPTSDGADTYTFSVKVTAAVSDLPDAQITSTSEAYNQFLTMRNLAVMDKSETGVREAKKTTSATYRDRDLEIRLKAELESETSRRRTVRMQTTPPVAPATRPAGR